MAAVLDSVRALLAPKTDTAFVIDRENPGDVIARERLLDATMGLDRRRKSSEAIRRNRVPAEGLALVARDEAGHVGGARHAEPHGADTGADRGKQVGRASCRERV